MGVPESEWVLLAYRLPREPSAPRVTVWRKLRRLGAVQVVDGLVALPARADTVEAFGWLADEVIEAGGEAWTWQARGSKQQDRALRQQLKEAVVGEYDALTSEAASAMGAPQRRTVERLRRTLRGIERRDYIAPKQRDDARRAVHRLAAAFESVPEPSPQ
jgi:Protein ChrB, N-terminal